MERGRKGGGDGRGDGKMVGIGDKRIFQSDPD
jgi:hypothetical protein